MEALSYSYLAWRSNSPSLKCPLFYRCGCRAQIRITQGTCHGEGFVLLEKSGTHNLTSHENNKSKYLKYKHIEALHNAVSVAPTVAATAIRRNLSLASEDVRIDPKFIRSIQHQVRKSRSLLTVAQLEGIPLAAHSVRSLISFPIFGSTRSYLGTMMIAILFISIFSVRLLSGMTLNPNAILCIST